MDTETREEIKRLEGYISGLSLTVAGIRHDLNACPCSETSGPRPLSRKVKMKNEPVLTIGVISAAIVALLAVFHVVLDVGTIEAILAVAIPLIGAVIARDKVTPV